MRELNIVNIVNILEGKYFVETSKKQQKNQTNKKAQLCHS